MNYSTKWIKIILHVQRSSFFYRLKNKECNKFVYVVLFMSHLLCHHLEYSYELKWFPLSHGWFRPSSRHTEFTLWWAPHREHVKPPDTRSVKNTCAGTHQYWHASFLFTIWLSRMESLISQQWQSELVIEIHLRWKISIHTARCW